MLPPAVPFTRLAAGGALLQIENVSNKGSVEALEFKKPKNQVLPIFYANLSSKCWEKMWAET